MTKIPVFVATVLATTSLGALGATISYNLNVEIIQVLDDAGGNPTPLAGTNGGSFLYESQVNEIWNQVGVQVTFSTSTWNNTEAQRLTSTERAAVYDLTYASATGDPNPTVALDALQIFFVMDHPGTGYSGPGTGWVDNPLPNPSLQTRNAGNAQLYIDGTFASNGRGVMANEGFAADSLSGTLAHEIGHALGLRHVNDVNGGAGAGTVQDPTYAVGAGEPNLMWAAGTGPSYDGGLDSDPDLTTLQENFFLNPAQIDAAIYNGLRLDPDGNGTGVLQNIPEPASLSLLLLGLLASLGRRRL